MSDLCPKCGGTAAEHWDEDVGFEIESFNYDRLLKSEESAKTGKHRPLKELFDRLRARNGEVSE